MPGEAIAKVEPILSARSLRGPFDYRVPESMASEVDVGSLLMVPFGPRRVLGVVVAMSDRTDVPPARLAEPVQALEAGVSPALVELGLWLAREYCSTPARGLGLVLPPGTGTGSVARRVKPLIDLQVTVTDRGLAALRGEDGRIGSRQKAALRALVDGSRLARELSSQAGVDRAAVRRLEKRGLVACEEVSVRRRPPETPALGAKSSPVSLTGAQADAVSRIEAAIDSRDGSLLLHGVTGSGKTEVYMAAAERALGQGGGVIVLVPEIALTPQTETRFRERFGDTVALLHSRMSAGVRYDEWRRLASGEARICVGPRSAVFAPVGDLRLIVVDEEHDSSYKQEGDPRYDAREVAAERARREGAALVMGTATPRPESWKSLERVSLPERVDGLPLPPVEVVDMRGTERGPLHPRTLEAFEEVRSEGGKAILLINRRGWAGYMVCRSCGHDWECPNCEVALVLHRDQGRLRCHHCGHSESTPERCPECDSITIARVGAGTQRVTEELSSILAPLPIFRLDSDAVADGAAHAEVLGRFQKAASGVLVGTQMVAKGHDFPDVTLSVILDADAALRIPDFRAEERTFALITQLAGRSGRGKDGGKVLVQALSVEAPSIVHAATHDSPGFLAGELERREALGYPPFAHLIEVGCAGPSMPAVAEVSERLADSLREVLPAGAALLGPAPTFKLRGKHRVKLLVKTTERAPAVAAVREAVGSASRSASKVRVDLSVDVEPQ